MGGYFLGKWKFKPTFLDEMVQLIDWRPIEAFLNRKLKRKANAVGIPACPSPPMFKVLLLQWWRKLSDSAIEQALLGRFSFIRFTGFSIEDDIPDETTIWRFRKGLIQMTFSHGCGP